MTQGIFLNQGVSDFLGLQVPGFSALMWKCEVSDVQVQGFQLSWVA